MTFFKVNLKIDNEQLKTNDTFALLCFACFAFFEDRRSSEINIIAQVLKN